MNHTLKPEVANSRRASANGWAALRKWMKNTKRKALRMERDYAHNGHTLAANFESGKVAALGELEDALPEIMQAQPNEKGQR